MGWGAGGRGEGQADVEGGPGWVPGPPGPSPTPTSSRTLRIPSAGPGTYTVKLFRNDSDPFIAGLVPRGGAVIAEVTVTIGGPYSRATWALDDEVPPDQGMSITGDAGLLCAAGTYSPFGPSGGAWPPCRPCPRGSASATAGANACRPCANKTYAAATGRTACIICPAAGRPPPVGSALVEPGNEDACAACPGLPCCGPACLGITAGPTTSIITTRTRAPTTSPRRATTPPPQASGTTAAAEEPVTTEPAGGEDGEGGSGGGGSGGSGSGGTVLYPLCGDGEFTVYPTPCWTGDRGGAQCFRFLRACRHIAYYQALLGGATICHSTNMWRQVYCRGKSALAAHTHSQIRSHSRLWQATNDLPRNYTFILQVCVCVRACCVVLCCVVLYCVVLCCVVLCCVVLCCVVLCV
jgi:hypothetical protein